MELVIPSSDSKVLASVVSGGIPERKRLISYCYIVTIRGGGIQVLLLFSLVTKIFISGFVISVVQHIYFETSIYLNTKSVLFPGSLPRFRGSNWPLTLK